jgi:hypothetical protein
VRSVGEHVLIRTDSNWGPPMTYPANLGRDSLIRLLHEHGARDLESAAGRAALQSKPDTVRLIYELAGRPSLEKWTLAGPAYTLSVEGTAVLFALGDPTRRPTSSFLRVPGEVAGFRNVLIASSSAKAEQTSSSRSSRSRIVECSITGSGSPNVVQ